MTKLRQSDWNSVAHFSPANSSSGSAVSGGEGYLPKMSATQIHSQTPIPTRAPKACEVKSPGFVNLTGVRFGRFTIIGIAADMKANATGKAWACRCICGAYEIRREKTIKRVMRGDAHGFGASACQWCAATEGLRSGQRGRDTSVPLIRQDGGTHD